MLERAAADDDQAGVPRLLHRPGLRHRVRIDHPAVVALRAAHGNHRGDKHLQDQLSHGTLLWRSLLTV